VRFLTWIDPDTLDKWDDDTVYSSKSTSFNLDWCKNIKLSELLVLNCYDIETGIFKLKFLAIIEKKLEEVKFDIEESILLK